jgi:dienelactone hydrolase
MTADRSQRRADARRRRRIAGTVAIGLVVAAAVAFAVAATGVLDSGAERSTASPASSIPVASPPSTTTPRTSAAPPSTTEPFVARSYAVGTRSVTFVDTSRPTSANGDFPGAPTRTLPTEFWYPAVGAPGSVTADAAPDRAHGPYPLVLFAHGYDVTPDFYGPLLARWAAAGYIVAAPKFPILSGEPGGASHVDYVETFADASFVIGDVLTLPAGDPLVGLVDPTRIAVAGHSDGEVIAYALGFLQCCRDTRVKSVISMAGNLDNANNPSVADTGTPILHILETGDEFDPYDASIAWDRANLSPPRWMVTLQSSHVPPYTQPGDPAFELVAKVTVAFLNGTLSNQPGQLDEIAADVAAVPAVGTLER